jgi:myosin heavy chain 6/7
MDESDMEKYLVRNVDIGDAGPDTKGKLWIPDKKDGYAMADIVKQDENTATVTCPDMTEKTFKKEEVGLVNPPKFEKWEDMSSLTYLNEAGILHNLKARYVDFLIYTYSGLFCVAINPYKRLPIYGNRCVNYYKGKRRTEVPPHVFAISDNAYSDMLIENMNQSVLITGESGAGKTENTKKVISYFALYGADADKKKSPDQAGKPSLEDQIVQTNPVLESFGNAKTVRNDNSSRFGKFIRIHFSNAGKLSGADIEHYLLEKARVTSQMEGMERCYHIFYQVLSPSIPGLAKSLKLTGNPEDYNFIKDGQYVVNSIDDSEEAKLTDEAFDILGFTPKEKEQLYKMCAGILHLGNMKFKQRPREENAEPDGKEDAELAAEMLGVKADEMLKGFVKPRVKVGSEYVTKGQNVDQVGYAQSAMGKGVFDKMFKWIITRVNVTLDTKQQRSMFIGVLDIAGFEIFEMNTFEQLCINFTNEKLQQFFNHTMFVKEQEEYKKEGIVWEFIDFGMDLAETILLIEKPMGILSILEEECIVPKATDMTFLKKLEDNHSGKCKSYGKPKPSSKSKHPVHFELHHYAGTVGYNITNWLEKNKDPMNDTVAELFSKSDMSILATIFKEGRDADDGGGGGGGGKGKKKKGGSAATISGNHKDQLNKLMTTLHSTQPHFIRCIVPNERKTPGLVEADLVLHQLRCNGVLEGIRICRKGFPNRLPYGDFKPRYKILAAAEVTDETDNKEGSQTIVQKVDLDTNTYRMGHTKLFFKAGVLGQMEELRDDKVAKIITSFQTFIRANIMRKKFKKLLDQRLGLMVIQRNVRKYLQLRNWLWFKLYSKVKPLLSMARAEDDMKAKEAEMKEFQEKFEKMEKDNKELGEKVENLSKEKADMLSRFDGVDVKLKEEEDKCAKVAKAKADLENQVKDLQERLDDEESTNTDMAGLKRKLEGEISDLKAEITTFEQKLHKSSDDVKSKEHQLNQMKDEKLQQEQSLGKVNNAKKDLENQHQKTLEDLQSEEDKVNHLNKLKTKLEQQCEETEDGLEREKKARSDLEKVRRKLEGDLKMAQEAIDELDRSKHELEDQVRKREFEIQTSNSKVSDLEGGQNQQRKKIKDLETRIEELEEENESERQNRAKVEKQRQELARELEDLTDRLDEQGGATSAQIELNKKREMELLKLRHDIEEITITNEQAISQLRKKQQEQLADMQGNVDNLQKIKSKLEKERNQFKMEAEDIQSNFEVISKNKQAVDRNLQAAESQNSELKVQLDEQSRQVMELGSLKSRLQSEVNDLNRHIEDGDSSLAQLNRVKQQLTVQLEDAKRTGEDEARQRSSLQIQFSNAQREIDQLRETVEDEEAAKSDMQRQLQKAMSEVSSLRSKYEVEGAARVEELEESRKKLMLKLQESEEALETQATKAANMEKIKNRVQGDLEDATIELERMQSSYANVEKAQKKFDSEIATWKGKVDEIQNELDNSSKDCRNYSTELFRLKGSYEEVVDALEVLKRENKSLQTEIQDLTDQLGDGGKSVHEIEKARRKAEQERAELQSALEEAEHTIENEEAKVMRVQVELSQLKNDLDKRLSEKDEEFENVRRNYQKTIDQVQSTLEQESRSKQEVLKGRKKLEADINEYEVALEIANRNNQEGQKLVKKLQSQVKDMQISLEEEQRAVDEMRESYNMAERRANLMSNEVQELRGGYEQAERQRRSAESDAADATDRITDVQSQLNALNAAKRKLEADLQHASSDVEDLTHELKAADERCKKAQLDAVRLAEELRAEQEHSQATERRAKQVDTQLKELTLRMDDAGSEGGRGSKRNLERAEGRIRELENEKAAESNKYQEAIKQLRKGERRLKEVAFIADEEKKEKEKQADNVDRANKRAMQLKKQVEDLEESNNQALVRLRKLQQDIDEAEERAEASENQLAKLRAKNRSSTGPPSGRAASVSRV